jgi:putative FmdB family regulatory protein
MPEYTYYCENCDDKFSMISSISKYREKETCEVCGAICDRSYEDDLPTLNSSVVKSDSELKTIGDLARRNSDRFSNDQKAALYHKHNSYKEEPSPKELPKGMSRIKKPPKTIWPK